MEESNSITIDNVEYFLEDFSNQARYYLGHVQDLQRQVQESRQKIEQLEIAMTGFTKLLKEELDK
jgi:archaellum component FlaC